ncbi:probable inactive histone-lysine N-methyltransferase SUVR2 isoform X2 [Cornus florida]|uniref:probable inactive histone-lysine N-methyltransferase SUVR2 isoform X2 n=1 Tax=Cornus florida TaxID=4283 RepID=UPI002896DC51|nr:probable inactive histone-lysine N-methyltransferase SUVR2 isoform X2 [Cornus florida]
MAPNPRVTKAFRAMRDIGIPEEKVKPVLKNLLKLYEKNWELIEEENYRALADAIFDCEDTKAAENKKKIENTDDDNLASEDQGHDEPERPLKRLRLRHQEAPVSSSLGNSSPRSGGTPLKRPKVEQPELPQSSSLQQSQGIIETHSNIEKARAESQPFSPHPLIRNKGKQPILPNHLAVQERSEPSQAGATDRTQPAKRTEFDSTSSPVHLRDKGKGPLSPQTAQREKGSFSERPAHAVLFKGPNVDPGIVLLPKQKVPNSHALIKPKDEPFTDDMPQFEVPIAVIHPEPSCEGNTLNGNDSIRELDGPEALVSQSVGEEKNGSVPASPSETRTNSELATINDESSANLEIASSSFGEVKISLSCNSALGKPDFHMPCLDEVLKLVEDKCLRSYKLLDPNFSVKKLMKDMCECFLELGSDSNESQGRIGVTPAIELLNKSNSPDALGARDMPFGHLNGSVNIQCAAEVALPQVPRIPPLKGMEDCVQPDKNITGNGCDTDTEQNCLEDINSRSLVVVQQHQQTPDNIRSLHDVNDIAKGQERVVISLVNQINSDCPPKFHYIPQNVVFQNAYVNFSLARIGDENSCSTCFGDCLSLSTPCACAHESHGDFAYTPEGLVKEDFLDECVSMNRDPQNHCHYYCKECPLIRSKNDDILEQCKGHLMRNFIKECWWKCGCSKHCGNRVVQRGINCNLQVFMTPEGKGWGLRTLEDLPKGAFVCEYVGEVLTNAELYERVSRSPSAEEHAYPVLLDADWSSEGVLKDEEALCLDATYYGNVARFINHRCFDSTLVEIPVEVETPDHHYYHLAFFTTRKVKALEELTWDYGIDFDDHDHPVKAFRCCCGSKFCRNIKRSSRSRSRGTRR